MCSCPAHHELVDCTCSCDHTADRMSQYRARIQELEQLLETRQAESDDLLVIARRHARRVHLLKVHGQELADEYSQVLDAIESGGERVLAGASLLDRWAAIRDKPLPDIGDRLPVRRRPYLPVQLSTDLREQLTAGVREAVIKLRSALALLGQTEAL